MGQLLRHHNTRLFTDPIKRDPELLKMLAQPTVYETANALYKFAKNACMKIADAFTSHLAIMGLGQIDFIDCAEYLIEQNAKDECIDNEVFMRIENKEVKISAYIAKKYKERVQK
jgi:hypothetical protein